MGLGQAGQGPRESAVSRGQVGKPGGSVDVGEKAIARGNPNAAVWEQDQEPRQRSRKEYSRNYNQRKLCQKPKRRAGGAGPRSPRNGQECWLSAAIRPWSFAAGS